MAFHGPAACGQQLWPLAGWWVAHRWGNSKVVLDRQAAVHVGAAAGGDGVVVDGGAASNVSGGVDVNVLPPYEAGLPMGVF